MTKNKKKNLSAQTSNQNMHHNQGNEQDYYYYIKKGRGRGWPHYGEKREESSDYSGRGRGWPHYSEKREKWSDYSGRGGGSSGYGNKGRGGSDYGGKRRGKPEFEERSQYVGHSKEYKYKPSNNKEFFKNEENSTSYEKNPPEPTKSFNNPPVPLPRTIKSNGSSVELKEALYGENLKNDQEPSKHKTKSSYNEMYQNTNNYTNYDPKFNETGARTKDRKENTIDDSKLAQICITCEKCLHKDTILTHTTNLKHEVLPIDQGILKLKKKELDKLEVIDKKLQSLIITENYISQTLESGLNLIFDPLMDIFNSLQQSAKDNDSFLSIVGDIKKMKSIKLVNTFIEYRKFQDESKKIHAKGETLLLQNNQRPFWLILTWFKVSLGLMLQSGKNCYSYLKDHNSYAPMTIQGDRILLSAFQKGGGLSVTSDKDALLFPYDFIKGLLDTGDSNVFMRISYNDKDEGYVYMRINNETLWGKQFTLMCNGTAGHSYKDTRFFRVCMKDKPGHHIWGGDYSNGDGSGGGQVFGSTTDPVNANPKPIVKGLLAARYGYKDRSTIFRVYITGREAISKKQSSYNYSSLRDEDPIDDGAFGYVEDGLHIFTKVAMMPDITKARITDVGTILTIG